MTSTIVVVVVLVLFLVPSQSPSASTGRPPLRVKVWFQTPKPESVTDKPARMMVLPGVAHLGAR